MGDNQDESKIRREVQAADSLEKMERKRELIDNKLMERK
jgi:hypothetical protein